MMILEAVKTLNDEAAALLRAESRARDCREVTKAKELMAAWWAKRQELDAIYKLLKK